MESNGFKRKLTAILSADVVGYSRLMGENEEETIRSVNTYRKLIASLTKKHHGRVVDSPGDNLLAEFNSVIDAVRCAVEVQEEISERNVEKLESQKMEYRIGINIGDVVEEGGRIYGDGVNIAARLESLAEPGGICISGLVYSHIKNKLKLEYEYQGKQTVKNISEPVPVYRIISLPKVSLRPRIEEEQTYSLSNKASIAILPFVNMSNDPDQEYFSDGMTEELIGVLAKLEGLKVISRTSAFYFKGEHMDLRAIGEKLKVDNVLEGSVRKAGNQLRISAQLIRVNDDTHLWSETYDRELKDVFAIQDEISQAILQSLKVKLLGTKTEPLVKDYTQNTEAYELFLKGRYFFFRGPFDYDKAIGYMEKAIKVDPDFAPAYSKLAMIHYHNAMAFSLPPKKMWSDIKTLSLQALEIDEMDAYAHALQGFIKSLYEYHWRDAEKHYKRAIELNPGNGDVHCFYAFYLIGVGRANEAIERMKHIVKLDPLSVSYNAILSLFFYFMGQFEKTITQSYKALELDPNNYLALVSLAMTHAAKGMYEEGIKIFQPVEKIPIITAFIAYLYGKAGKNEEAQKILEDLLERSKQGYFSPDGIAAIYTSLGNKDKAFEWLEKSFEEHDTTNYGIKVEPMFNDLHSDPRWTKLMEKMGLAD